MQGFEANDIIPTPSQVVKRSEERINGIAPKRTQKNVIYLTTDEIKHKWELIGTHTGRRTFIVNALSHGI